MRNLIVTSALAALAFTVPTLVTSQAHASLAACGDINVQANAQCEAKVGVQCTAQCTPINFQAACAAKGYASCQAQCTHLPSVDCTGSCEGSCEGSCQPGTFDCNVSCQGTCDGNCSGKCASSANQADCEAQCKATCKGECDASCSGTPVDCQGGCNASCKGSCTADANLDCQASCQAQLSVDCEASLQGGCEANCSRPEGAIFCNGQFVDDNGNAQECLDSIKAWLDANAKFYGTASASCSGSQCEAQANGGCSLGMIAPSSPSGTPYYIAALAALAGIVVGKARRRR